MAFKALVYRIFGLGKDKNEKKTVAKTPRNHPYDEVADEQLNENRKTQPSSPPRQHPYDEVTDEQLNQNRRAVPRVHPYDEVSDAVLQENRNKPVRRHNYDEVDLDRTMSKVKVKNDVASNSSKATKSAALNYVEVELPPGMSESDVKAKKATQSTIYSEVRASSAAGGGRKS